MRRFSWMAILLLSACAAPREPARVDGQPADYSEPIVLFVSPSGEEIERMRSEGGEDFYTAADDTMWYRAHAREWVEEMGIASAAVERGDAIFMVGGEPVRFDWSNERAAWFLVIYNGIDPPEITWDAVVDEARAYFERRREGER
jgi:hypothetical protein